jgi:hypothetical protein
MERRVKRIDDFFFYISVAAMVILILSVYLIPYGSSVQRLLIFLGALILFASASASRQKVVQAMEVIAIAGVITSILQLAPVYALTVTLVISAIIIAYLTTTGYYQKEPIGVVGSIGFVFLAVGFAFDTGSNPLMTGLALGVGSLTIAAYSAMAYWLYKVRLQVVIMVLNLVFAVSPLLLFLSTIGI